MSFVITLKDSLGCEISRFVAFDAPTAKAALQEALNSECWELDVGDVIEISETE